MQCQLYYAPEIRYRFPRLCSRALRVDGIDATSDISGAIARLKQLADGRLAAAAEADFVEIQAWRRAFSAMGLKPTQYRCASEALLRRCRKAKVLPSLHPLIDLCNASSLASAIPVTVFDIARIAGAMIIRLARGDEPYESFAGDIEHPEPGEVISADYDGRAQASTASTGFIGRKGSRFVSVKLGDGLWEHGPRS